MPFGVDGMDVDEKDENEDEIDVVNVEENFDDSGLALEERLNEVNILAFHNQFHYFNPFIFIPSKSRFSNILFNIACSQAIFNNNHPLSL